VRPVVDLVKILQIYDPHFHSLSFEPQGPRTIADLPRAADAEGTAR
jgi:hypothetical protein